MPSNGDDCPWCGRAITTADDPVAVTASHRRATDVALHRDCALEWNRFMEHAQDVAKAGNRHSLIRLPLEHGWDLEPLDGCDRR